MVDGLEALLDRVVVVKGLEVDFVGVRKRVLLEAFHEFGVISEALQLRLVGFFLGDEFGRLDVRDHSNVLTDGIDVLFRDVVVEVHHDDVLFLDVIEGHVDVRIQHDGDTDEEQTGRQNGNGGHGHEPVGPDVAYAFLRKVSDIEGTAAGLGSFRGGGLLSLFRFSHCCHRLSLPRCRVRSPSEWPLRKTGSALPRPEQSRPGLRSRPVLRRRRAPGAR